MPRDQKKHRTILHFSCDPATLTLRGGFLKRAGYRLLHSSNGFEAIELSTRRHVGAVVLDLDRNAGEVTLIAQEIKRLRPRLPTLVLTEAVPVGPLLNLADALVPGKTNPKALVKSLRELVPPGTEPANRKPRRKRLPPSTR